MATSIAMLAKEVVWYPKRVGHRALVLLTYKEKSFMAFARPHLNRGKLTVSWLRYLQCQYFIHIKESIIRRLSLEIILSV